MNVFRWSVNFVVAICSLAVIGHAQEATLSSSPSSLTFNYQIGGSAPPGQLLSINSVPGGVSVSFAVGGNCSWLSLVPGGFTTPLVAGVAASPTGFAAGSYSCTITVSATSAPAVPVSVPATLNVTNPTCTFNASPMSAPTIPAPGGSLLFTITASPSGCSGGSWSSSVSDSSWMSISPSSGTAPGSSTATFQANPNPTPRSGSITIAGTTVSINQAAAPITCTFSASPSSLPTVPSGGSSSTFTISASPSGCTGGSWSSSVSDSTWMSISPSSGTVAGSATATFQANPNTNLRTGSITIAGTSISVNQAAATITCTFSATPTSVPAVPAGGGSTTFNISASPGGCVGGSWSASVSDPTWMSISPSGGTAAGSATATFQANTSSNPRSGAITVAGQSVAVSQNGVIPACTFTAAPTSVPTVLATGGSASFTITNAGPSGCSGGAWTTSVTDPSWMTISPSGGTAAGTANATFLANPATTPRSGTLTIAGQGVAVNQAGQPQPLQMSCNPGDGPTVLQQIYSTSCTASGGTPPYSWTSTGLVPPGLVLTNASGQNSGFAGAAQTAGSYSYGIQVMDSAGHTQAVPFSANIAGVLSVTTQSLPGASVGATYNQAVDASGGIKPYMWTSSGTFPPGLTLSSSGLISGAATATGTYSFTVKVTDSAQATATQPLSIVVSGNNTLTASPGALTFMAHQDGSQPPGAQTISVFATVSSPFTAAGSGGFLQVSPISGQTPGVLNVSVNAAGMAPGDYSGTVTVTGAAGTNTSPVSVGVKLTVVASTPPQLSVSSTAVSGATVQNGGAASQQVSVQNTGSGSVAYSAQVVGAPWLSLLNSSGSVAGGASAVIGLVFNPAGLAAGTYTGSVQITGNGQNLSVDVSLAVSSLGQSILLSQSDLEFTAVQNGPVPGPQNFAVLNLGAGTMNWSATAGVLGGGPVWFQASPANGSSQAGAAIPAPVTVSVNQAGLAPADYFGYVAITAGGAANSPQQTTVHLKVLPPGQSPAPQALPSGAIFSAVAAGPSPAAQTIVLSNLGAGAVSFTTTVSTEQGDWLSRTPSSGSVNSGATTSISIQANPSGLAAGIYRGALRVAFSDPNNTVREVTALLVIAPQSPTSSSFSGDSITSSEPRDASSGCSDTDLAIAPVGDVRSNTTLTAGQGATMQFLVKDCSGSTVDRDAAQISFNNQDQPVTLSSRGNGMWEGTWTPSNKQPTVLVSPAASSIKNGKLRVSTPADFTVRVAGSTNGLQARITGIFNGASYAGTGEISPGSWTAIFGDQIADSKQIFDGTPFPQSLQGTQVTLGGQPLPIYFVNETQVNALIPSALNPNTRFQLQIVRHSNTPSVPVDVTVADLQPGLYSLAQNGQGQGAVLLANTGTIAGPTTLSNARPVKRGDFIQIYGTGLGPVTNTPADGTPALASPLSLMKLTPQVSIGGAQATVVFAGLAPGNVGLYQINAEVPASASTGDAVPLSVSVGNAVSNVVTIAVQ
jgi:uncharacterized protein (TIGR03437 family)